MKRILVILMLVSAAWGDRFYVDWNRSWDLTGNDTPQGIAVDISRNVYVTGFTGTGNPDFMTLKYSKDGVKQGDDIIFDAGFADMARDVAAEESYFYVVGQAYNGVNDDFLTIKYTNSGDTVWTRTFDSGVEDRAFGVSVNQGEVFVTGHSDDGGTSKIVTIRYDQNGDSVWSRVYDAGAYDAAYFVDVCEEFVYVVGYTDNTTIVNFRILKYGMDGSLQWNRIYNSGKDDVAYAVAADYDGSIYVAGESSDPTGSDLILVKYDENGDTLWSRIYDRGDDDGGRGVDVVDGNVYVTGYSEVAGNSDLVIIKYQHDGQMLTTETYDSGDDDIGEEIVSYAGYVHVAGLYDNGVNLDYRTMCYFDNAVRVTEPNGGDQLVIGEEYQIWWNWTGGVDTVILEYRNESTDGFDTIAVVENYGAYMWTVPDNPGVFTRLFISDVNDYADVRDSSNADFSIVVTGIAEESLPVSNLIAGSGPTGHPHIHYHAPQGSLPHLKIYSSGGRLVREVRLVNTSGQWFWDGLDDGGKTVPAGVYFVTINAEPHLATARVILIR